MPPEIRRRDFVGGVLGLATATERDLPPGPRLSDAELFGALDLKGEEMAPVRRAPAQELGGALIRTRWTAPSRTTKPPPTKPWRARSWSWACGTRLRAARSTGSSTPRATGRAQPMTRRGSSKWDASPFGTSWAKPSGPLTSICFCPPPTARCPASTTRGRRPCPARWRAPLFCSPAGPTLRGWRPGAQRARRPRKPRTPFRTPATS